MYVHVFAFLVLTTCFLFTTAEDSTISGNAVIVTQTDDTLDNISTFSEGTLSTFDSHPARKVNIYRAIALRARTHSL